MGLTPSVAASARIVGSRPPGRRRPSRTPDSTLAAISPEVDPRIVLCTDTIRVLYYNDPVATKPTIRTRVRRHPERGAYDREAIDAILDEAVFCHVGFVVDGQPFVIPTIHARMGEVLYLHGSPASRMLRELAGGVDVCVAATLLDGLVLARSVYHHSLNYRSAVILGRARPVVDPEQKRAALEAIVEHVVAGRTRDARPPSDKELAGTSVLELPIDEASAKVRKGPPSDFDADVGLPVWAGVVPIRAVAGDPEPDEHVQPGLATPEYLRAYRRP
jgi:nitroimidazol reductase NimA-like FMN-containing flavoprotein (pyridoxamine 5'-phosphate oxidase superfamily)